MATPEAFMLWCLLDWSEGPQILAQFLFDSEKGCPESSEPKGCLKQNLKHDFWTRGQNLNVQIEGKKIWTSLESWTIIFGNIIFWKKFDFGLFMRFMGIWKQKFAMSQRKSVIRKNFTVQKSLRKSFHSILGGQKNWWNFLFFPFFCDTLYVLIFFHHF